MSFFEGKRFEDIADESAKKVVRILIKLILVFFVGAALVALFVMKNGVRPSHSVEVKDLEICGISYSNNGQTQTVSVCGVVINDESDTVIVLDFVLFYQQEDIIIDNLGSNSGTFEEGFFKRTLSLKETIGDYRIEVRRARETIGTLEFSVSK